LAPCLTRRPARRAIGRVLAMAAVLVAPLAPASAAIAPSDSDLAGYSVTATLSDGSVHSFESRAGEDLGDFIAPFAGFKQRCIRVRDPHLPLTVFFRPDRDTPHEEVVVEWGDIWAARPASLAPYSLAIKKNGTTLTTLSVPTQPWLTRYRWQSAPRPVLRTAADLVAAKLVAPYGRIATVAPTMQAQPYKLLGISGVTPAMPTTGERNDIGIEPEHTSEFLATGNAAALQDVLAWAEASGSIPWHIRDAKTGAPLNYDEYPNASTYYDQTKVGPPELHLASDSPVKIDAAHAPEVFYVAYQLTGDPYFLEEGQEALTYLFGDYPNPQHIIRNDQTREFAWTLRTMFFVAKATPESVPAWLLPRTYWQDKLARNLKWVTERFVKNLAPVTAIFRSGVSTDQHAPWQEDYLAAAIGVGVWIGFEEWKPVFVWKVGADLARTNGTSGWPRSRPTFYYFTMTRPDGSTARDWAELAAIQNPPVLGAPDGRIDTKNTDANYAAYTRGVLALAVRLRIPGAADSFAWIDGQIGRTYLPWRWAFTVE
jgi:hypothetical protein